MKHLKDLTAHQRACMIHAALQRGDEAEATALLDAAPIGEFVGPNPAIYTTLLRLNTKKHALLNQAMAAFTAAAAAQDADPCVAFASADAAALLDRDLATCWVPLTPVVNEQRAEWVEQAKALMTPEQLASFATLPPPPTPQPDPKQVAEWVSMLNPTLPTQNAHNAPQHWH